METTQTISVVTVLDILSGDAPSILTQEETRYRNNLRLFTQKLPICDPNLFRQLEAEVHRGDQIEVTVVTEWGKETSRNFLVAYRLISPSKTALKATSRLL